MYRFNQVMLSVVVLSAATLAGCSTAKPKPPSNIDMQRAAMHRWNSCLERNTTPATVSAIKINQVLERECEGHRRDVIATFPKHMSQQIDQLLVSNAYQLLENAEDTPKMTANQGELMQTLLR